jgi:endo-1,4-beta-xylanase
MNNFKIKILSVTYSFLIVFFSLNSIGCKESAKEITALKTTFNDYFLMGVALNSDQVLEKDKIISEIVNKHFNSITAENVLKWERVHPELNEYNFEPCDEFVSFGEKRNMFIVGHVLLWHQQTPRWVFESEKGKPTDRETLLNRLHEHIQKVVGRYRGRIDGWDVVNEALDEDGKLKQSEWLKIIGEDYLVKAFEFAHQADPDAELYYNDFSLENEPKRNGAIELIKKLKTSGVRLDGIGLQGHYKMDWPTASQLDSSIKAFANLGLKVMITELDVDALPYEGIEYGADISLNVKMREDLDPYRNGMPDSAQQAFSNRYSDLFKVFIENKNSISRITFWGVTDKESWLNYWPVMGRTNYPLLFDREGKEKPAYQTVINLVKKNESN